MPEARLAGFFYLLVFITGGLAFASGSRFVVQGDPAAAATNILAHETAFSIGLGHQPHRNRSNFLPRILGVGMVIAAMGWLTFLWSPLANSLAPYNFLPGMLGEAALTLWLLVMGV